FVCSRLCLADCVRVFSPLRRPPPRSTPFPYTTLFRSRSSPTATGGSRAPMAGRPGPRPDRRPSSLVIDVLLIGDDVPGGAGNVGHDVLQPMGFPISLM